MPIRSLRPAEDGVASQRYFAWKAVHPNEAQDPARIWAAAWQAGAWDAIRRTSQLADLVPRLEELIALYRNAEVEREFEDIEATRFAF